ncbi:hypothetical protein AWM70_21470 [Paenibacillus yonginensis]|uniref:SWIM-type domain-containing protein n=1 Tax=Paenibacillus yonginensis TaxID=1462996 RepID=A0A1B1N5X8_9BACL|nr:hypothetical protein AWM70_21470 [Paenibacillus yonginensis]
MAKEKAAAGKIQLTAAPGEWKAEWIASGSPQGQRSAEQAEESAQAGGCSLVLPIRRADEGLTGRVLGLLKEKPMLLAALLAGPAAALSEELAQLLPAEPPLASPPPAGGTGEGAQPAAEPGCACGSGGCKYAAALREAALSGWGTDMRLALTALDLAPEKLARAVFAAWAEEGAPEPGAPAEPAAAQRAAGSAAPRPAGSGPGIAEWLSTAAAKGALHEPGPGFAEARGLPEPQADPGGGAAASVRSWLAGRLPAVPAADGLDLIVRRAAQRAAGLHATTKRPGR